MAIDDQEPGASPPTTLVFGGERCDFDQTLSAANALGASAIRNFDGCEWFSAAQQVGGSGTPIIVLDAAEGISEQDRFYARLVRFLGLTAPIVFVGNLSLIGYEQEQYDLIEEEYRELLTAMQLAPLEFFPLPLNRSDLMPWWRHTVPLSALSDQTAQVPERRDLPLRMTVTSSQSQGSKWTVAATLIAGSVAEGDEVLSSPANLRGVVHSISDSDAGTQMLTFDAPYYVEPGEVLSHMESAPVETDVFRVKAYWSGAAKNPGDRVKIETVYGPCEGVIQSVEQIFSTANGTVTTDTSVSSDTLVELVVRADRMLAIDHVAALPEAAGIRLFDAENGSKLLATGHISMEGYADQRNLLSPKAENTTPIQFAVGEAARSASNGHQGGVLWFTGLSGSGKSTLAVALEARLFEKGYQVFVLDGDNVRQGLTSNLGFSPDDRSENIRRVGEVAALFRQAGVIVISSFISPYRSDRDRARHAAYSSFHEIYIKADIETCIGRDPKGLYERALNGDIPEFTGISAPYEAPAAPELVIDTQGASVDACVEQLVNYVDRNFRV